MKNRKPVLLIISSVAMLLISLPMAYWCLGLINSAALNYTYPYAGVGCFAAVLLYALSLITAIVGLVSARRPDRRCSRRLGYIQLAVAVALIVPLAEYSVVTMPPLLVFTILYLIGAGRRQE